MSACRPARRGAHRLKAELGYGARRNAQELGIALHTATHLLAQPLGGQRAERWLGWLPPTVRTGGRAEACLLAVDDSQQRAVLVRLTATFQSYDRQCVRGQCRQGRRTGPGVVARAFQGCLRSSS